MVRGGESLKKEDAEPNTLNGNGKILQTIVILVRKKLHHDAGGPRGRDPPLRFTVGVTLPLLEPGRDHRKGKGERRVRDNEDRGMSVLLLRGTPPYPTCGSPGGLTMNQGGSGPPVSNRVKKGAVETQVVVESSELLDKLSVGRSGGEADLVEKTGHREHVSGEADFV